MPTSLLDSNGMPRVVQPGDGITIAPVFDANIITFGAVTGEDSTDAVLAAVASLPAGGRVIVPAGVYDIAAEIVLANNIQLVGGRGSVLRKAGTNFNVIRITGDNNSVFGLEIDGNSKAQGSLILITGADNVVFDCYLHNNGLMADGPYGNQSMGIALDGQTSICKRNTVMRCRIRANHDIGISQHTATDNVIVDNNVSDNGLEGVTIDVTSHNARVQDNRISGNCIRGGVGGIGIDGSNSWIIVDNNIDNTASNLAGIKTQNNTGPSRYGICSGNTVLNNGGWGIWLFNGAGGPSTFNVVTDNVVKGNVTGQINIDATCDNNVVQNNSLNGAGVTDAGANNADLSIRRAFTGQFNTSNSDGALGNSSLTCSARRVGDCLECQVRLAVGSSPITGTGNIEFRLPRSTDAGYGGVDLTIDEAKLNNGAGSLVISAGIYTDASANDRRPVMVNEGHNNNYVGIALTGNIGSGGTVTMTNPWVPAQNDVINIWFTVPITGWGVH